LIDLFLPKNQRALDGKLSWCKQNQDDLGKEDESALANVITTPAALTKAIDELHKWKLISKEGRELKAHRVVQEAVNYQERQDMQDSFNAAAHLVYEAFPKSSYGDYFSSQAEAAQAYVHHAAHLSRIFASLNAKGETVVTG
jgi:hypothetical protein